MRRLERGERGRGTVGGEQDLHAADVTRCRGAVLEVALDDDLLGVVGIVAHRESPAPP